MSDDKDIKMVVKSLQSGKISEILFTIDQLRISGNPLVLPHLFDILIGNPPAEISKAIIDLLNELKNQSCVIEIIKALKSEKYLLIRKELLTSCWYSGLDYSDYLTDFIHIFVAGDFLIAFEAFTIIETFEKEFDGGMISELINVLKNNAKGMTEAKSNLLIELVLLLERKSTPLIGL
jgi:hypothetical protein